MDPRELILDHWENYLGVTLNRVYLNPDFRMVASKTQSGPAYNQVVPEDIGSDLSGLKNLSVPNMPFLHGEESFVKDYRQRWFPDTEEARQNHWMKFEGPRPGKERFKLDFRWIGKSQNEDYLGIKKNAFGADQDYIDLHRSPARTWGEDFHRLVAYDKGKPVSAGEIRFGRKGSYIYSLSTLDNYSGKGIATEVLRRLLDRAEGNVYLLAEPDIKNFYDQRGFEEIFCTQSFSGGSWNKMF